MIIPTRVVVIAVLALALVIGALVGIKSYGDGRYAAGKKEVQDQWSAEILRNTNAVLADERTTATKEGTHAAATQENSDAFTSTQPTRDLVARSDLDRVERLRVSAERRASTYRAQAEGNAAACRDLADRHAALDRHVVEGVAVVGSLRTDLARRDAEVALLVGQIKADRELLTTAPSD